MKALLKNGGTIEFTPRSVAKNGDIDMDGFKVLASEVKSVKMNEDEFDELFETMPGGVEAGEDSGLYETYGDDLDVVSKIAKENPKRVWTMVDGDSGGSVLTQGMHFVNRIAYVLTENEMPWPIQDFQCGDYDVDINNNMEEDSLFNKAKEEGIVEEVVEEIRSWHSDCDHGHDGECEIFDAIKNNANEEDLFKITEDVDPDVFDKFPALKR